MVHKGNSHTVCSQILSSFPNKQINNYEIFSIFRGTCELTTVRTNPTCVLGPVRWLKLKFSIYLKLYRATNTEHKSQYFFGNPLKPVYSIIRINTFMFKYRYIIHNPFSLILIWLLKCGSISR